MQGGKLVKHSTGLTRHANTRSTNDLAVQFAL